MGRLFWKFFIVIWIAQIIGTMSVMVAVELKQGFEGDNRPNAVADRSANLLIESAATALQYGGPMALRKLMDDTTRHELVVVDENNRELLGRTVDPAALQRAQAKSHQRENADGVRRITLADGHSYLLFVDAAQKLTRPMDTGPRPPHGSKLLPTEPLVAHLLASLIVAALLAHYLSRPIRSLRSAFQAVASGNLRVGVANAVAKRKDELADLLREFDRMAAQLRVLMDGQRRLLHDVSHELRSPMARMQAAAGLARQQPEKTKDMLDRIDSEIIRMDRLIGELLTLSRLETSEIGVLDAEVCIDEVLDDIVDSAQFEAESAKKRFYFSGESGAIIKGSAELLHRAIENVVRNAIQHTHQGCAVYVKVNRDSENDMLKISISDHGPGVPEAELNSIFKPFFRGSKADGNPGGHGLGLAIARRIIEAHSGSIRAFNLSKGGLCVQIAVPVFRRN
ncbi:ATP-binding protein [Undibacterium arcticum]|uniref:histidine kinase n=1 Tax=Undibacterium arcticum TaxID=1762892 RepID=A0ABV7F5M1_9BURK